jgi:acetyl-CoA C-acetyltransferase
MTDTLIAAACRTPIGRFQGNLSGLSATDLGAIVIREVLQRSRLPAETVDEVIMGNVLCAGAGQAPARQAALRGGLPATVSALTINKVCGSGLKAVMLAAQAIRAGEGDVLIAGGMESMSRAPWLLPRDHPDLGALTLADSMLLDGLTCAFGQSSMGVIAEDLASREGISREAQDAFSLQSHRLALAAQQTGMFQAELVPVTIRDKSGERVINQDEGPRGETSLERLAKLKPAFRSPGSVTAGNSSMISDGAAAVLVASEDAVQQHHLTPMARILAWASSGGPPEDLFIAPVEAIQQAVQKAGLAISDIDLFEINEAFAVQMIACMRRLGLSADRVNRHGGAIALGHPIGGSGARVLVTLLHVLHQSKARYGVAALCLGGGNAVAMVIERVEQ